MHSVSSEKISIIIHPVTRELLFELEPGFGKLPLEVTKKILEWAMPFSVSPIAGVQSTLTGETINGDLILFPLLMEQIVDLKSSRAVDKLVKAARLARDNGAKLTGLVAYTAMVGKKGVKIQERVDTPLTTGLNLTAAILPVAVEKAVQALACDIEKAKMLIFGHSPIAHLFLKRFGEKIAGLCLCSPKQDILENYYNTVPEALRRKVTIMSALSEGKLSEMDIVVNATGNIPAGFSEAHLKSGAIVLDMSYPRAVYLSREDVLLIDGVAVIPPGCPKFSLNFGLPPGLCYPCMAEPMVLAFEKNLVSYSLGSNVCTERAEHILSLAFKHGFKIGPLTCYEQVISEEKIKNILCHRKS